jgi:hypothetical protein
MDPFAIYLLLFFGAVALGIVALIVAPGIKRTCPECGSDVPISKRVCRVCRYRFI